MKFIDELDIERVNQVLNFETIDCKIVGGCDIFTTKAVASDRKLYKTIDHHLDTILQDNESYNLALQQQIALDAEDKNERSMSPGGQRRDSSSFWEQKRRMSVSDSPIYLQHINGNLNESNGAQGEIVADLVPPIIKTSKLNDHNLKELVSNYEAGYSSSSSVESLTHKNKERRTSSLSSTGGKVDKLRADSSTANDITARSVLNDTSRTLNLGPFGPINEPSSRRTFAYLIAILNASYPDHDFSLLEPTDFKRSSIKSFIAKFENSMYSLGRKPEEWIWEVINSHMTLSDCVLYQYRPTQSFLDDEPGHLWSLIGFFFNKKRKRVAYVYLLASRLQLAVNNAIGTPDEMQNEDGTFRNNNTTSFDNNNTQFEGEYDLTYEENAIVDDDDEE